MKRVLVPIVFWDSAPRFQTHFLIWDGEYRDIPINEAETDPLVGISLLYGYDLQIQTVEGGSVTIKRLD